MIAARLFADHGGEYFPNYIRPKSWNEWVVHIMWAYYRRSPVFTVMQHKYLAKQHVREKAGEQHVVKLLGVYDWPEDIDFEKLPKSFVLKATIGFQGKQVIVVRDKSEMDKADVITKLRGFISNPKNYNITKFTKNRILAEEYLENSDGTPISDYKFFCSMGDVFACRVHEAPADDITSDAKKLSHYSIPDWQYIPALQGRTEDGGGWLDTNPNVPRPKNLDAMIELSKKMSADLPLLRLDLYGAGERILVGEMTTAASGGWVPMSPAKYDFEFGSHVKFPDDPHVVDEWIARDIAKYGKAEDLI
ncbi:MAG: hypothetical protein LBL21_05090 [Rickettsiales bacterium]|nr:hypothetical protein [Rickettsiales bacterium]